MALLKQEIQDISTIPHTLQTPYVSQSSPKVFMFTDTVSRSNINKAQVILNEDPDSTESEQGNSSSDASPLNKTRQDQDGNSESNQGTKMYSTIVLATSNTGFNNTFLNGEILNKPLVGLGSNCIIKYEDDIPYFEDTKSNDSKKWNETVKTNSLSDVISDWTLCGCPDKRSDTMPVLMNLIGSSSIIDGSNPLVSSDLNQTKIKEEVNDNKSNSDKYSNSAIISPSFNKGTTSQSTVLQYLGSPNSTATLTYHHDGLLQDATGSSGVSILLTASDIGVLGATNPTVNSTKEVGNESDLPLSPQSFSNSGVIVPNSCTYMFGIDSDSENVEKAVDPNKLCVKKPRPKTTSPSRQGPQTCPTCNKVFSNASALTKHKLTHSDERKYVCPTCGKAFKRQDHLNGHMLTHRNKKPYECKAEGCGKSYCDARSLRRHTENHHNGNISNIGPSGSDDNSKLDDLNGTQDSDSHGHITATNISVTTGGHLQQLLSSPPLVNCQSPNVIVGNWKPINGKEKGPSKQVYKCNPKAAKISCQKKLNQKSTNDELTDEQLALIQQIMQQTREAAEAMQHQQKQNKQISSKTKNSRSQSHSKNTIQFSNGENGSKVIESKPVECSICERKFKNVPALNGHMRLHGGYFKKVGKNVEDKKSDKKDNGSAPLQTASSSIRALIEEKIIQKRISSNSAGSTNASFIGNMDRSKLSSASTPDSVSSIPTGPPPPYPGTSILVTSSPSVVSKSVESNPIYSSEVSDKVPYSTTLEHSPTIDSDSFLNVKQEDNFDTHSVLNELLKGRSSSTSSRRDLSSELDDLEVLGLSASPDDSMMMLGDLNLNGTDEVLNMKSSLVNSSQANSFSVDSLCSQSYSLSGTGGNQYSQGSSDGTDNFYTDQLHSDYVPILDQETLQGLSGVDDAAFSTVFQDAKDLNFSGDPLEVSDYQSQEHIRDLIQAAKELQKLEESQSQSGGEVLHDIQADSLHDLGYADNQSLQELSAATIQENLLQTQSQTTFQSPLQSPIHKNLPLNQYNYSSIQSMPSPLEVQVNQDTCDHQTHIKSEVANSFHCHDQQSTHLQLNVSNSSQCNSIQRNFSVLSHDVSELATGLVQSSSLSTTKLSLPSDISSLSLKKGDFLSKFESSDDNSDMKDNSAIKNLGYLSPQSALAAAKTHIANFIKERSKLSAAQSKLESKDLNIVNAYPGDVYDYNYVLNNCESSLNNKRTKSKISVSIDSMRDDVDDDVFVSPTSLPSSPVKFCKKPRPAPLFIPPQVHSGYTGTNFQSRLRIPRLYDPLETKFVPFTPPPMLSPMRCGTGLFWQVLTCPSSKSKSSNKGFKFGFESQENVPEGPLETDIQPHVNLGPQHQCEIPSFIGGKCQDLDKDSLVWHPDTLENHSQLEINNYLEFSCSAAVPHGGRNIEYALHLLHFYQGDIQSAMLELMAGPSLPHSLQDFNYFESDNWKPDEMETFQLSLSKHDKDFHLIAQELKSKSVEQCIQFYYFWKKLCFEDSKRLRLQRRKREADHLCNLRFRMAALGVDGDLLQSTPKSEDLPITPGTLESLNCLEGRPYNCDFPDCNAYFQSKQALMSHIRVHKSSWFTVHRSSSPGSASITSSEGTDEYPCKVCGKIFSKVKSRSAHMKTHRPADAESRRSRNTSVELNTKSDSVPSTPTTPVTTDLQVKTLDTKALISQKTFDMLSLGQESLVTMNFSPCSN